MMKQSELIIRAMYPKEYPLLREFLYQATFSPREHGLHLDRSSIFPSYQSILPTSVLSLVITALQLK